MVTTWYDKHCQCFSNHPKWCRMFFLHQYLLKIQRYRNASIHQVSDFTQRKPFGRIVTAVFNIKSYNFWDLGRFQVSSFLEKKKDGGYEGGVIPLHHGNSKTKSLIGFSSIGRCEYCIPVNSHLAHWWKRNVWSSKPASNGLDQLARRVSFLYLASLQKFLNLYDTHILDFLLTTMKDKSAMFSW